MNTEWQCINAIAEVRFQKYLFTSDRLTLPQNETEAYFY